MVNRGGGYGLEILSAERLVKWVDKKTLVVKK